MCANEQLSKYEASLNKRIQCFEERAPKYNGNPEKVLEWCENLGNHMFNHKWETIPNEEVKRMLCSCITRFARKDVPLCPAGLEFEEYETGVFFTKLLNYSHKRNTRKARNRNT